MSILSVGDLAQSVTLTRSASTMKSDILRLSTELTTGVTENTSAHLAGDFGPLAGIEASLAQLKGYAAVTAESGLFTDAMQAALGRITDMTSDLGQSLLSGATTSTPSRISALGADAAQKFETAVAALNLRLGDRSLFGGVATSATPLPGGDALLDRLQSLTAGMQSAAEVEDALDTWFSAADGYGQVYRGGVALAGLAIAQGEVARVDITAADPAIRDSLKGLAMAALLDRGLLSGRPEGRADIVRRAGESLVASQTGLATLTARLGSTQAQIGMAEQRNTAEASALRIARSDILSVDGYEVASRLQETQTQLETLYALTSRMSRLSLANFL